MSTLPAAAGERKRMSTAPVTVDSPQAPPLEEDDARLPKAALAFYVLIGALRRSPRPPRASWASRGCATVARLLRVRGGRRARAAVRRRRAQTRTAQRGDALVPHHRRLPAPRSAAARAAAGRTRPGRAAPARMAEEASALVRRDVQHLQLHAHRARRARRQPLVARAGRAHLGRARPHRRRGSRRVRRVRSRQSLCARDDVPPRPQRLRARVGSLRERVDRRRVRARLARRRRRGSMELQPVAGSAGSRADRFDQPLARGAGPAAAGAHRSEDGALQRSAFRSHARRRALASEALRPAAIAADGRLDLLRDINNEHGHLAGDMVLSGVADVFREELRDYDVPARFGGEEFSILLPETSSAQALAIADRIRQSLAARRFEVERPASRSAPRSRSVSPNTLRTPLARTDWCTRPTSRSTARSCRDGTASSRQARSSAPVC